MNGLRVPTVSLPVEIVDHDERSLKGTIFLPAMAHRHEGPARPDEWINENAPFFPFLPSDGGRSILLNKARVVALTVPLSTEEHTIPMDLERTARVIVECGAARFQGVLRMDMPDEKSRVLDYANRAEAFLELFDDERCHLIQKRYITRIIEIKES